jgi:hypothetical protein
VESSLTIPTTLFWPPRRAMGATEWYITLAGNEFTPSHYTGLELFRSREICGILLLPCRSVILGRRIMVLGDRSKALREAKQLSPGHIEQRTGSAPLQHSIVPRSIPVWIIVYCVHAAQKGDTNSHAKRVVEIDDILTKRTMWPQEYSAENQSYEDAISAADKIIVEKD